MFARRSGCGSTIARRRRGRSRLQESIVDLIIPSIGRLSVEPQW